MMASTFQRVQRIAADVLQVPIDKVTLQSSPDNVENWDSVQQLNLVLALEQEFDLQFEPEEMDQMKNIGQIVAVSEAKLKKSN